MDRVPQAQTDLTPHIDAAFRETQARFWDRADDAHYRWQTDGGYFTGTERALLAAPAVRPGARVLEVGCGEGGNLANLDASRLAGAGCVVGTDLFLNKLRFARNQLPGVRFAAGDALRLPFVDASFDTTLCRDVLHHLEDREAAIRELVRVTAPGGEVWIIEPNGRNPLIAAFAAAMPHERGQLQTSPASLRALVSRHLTVVDLQMHQPLPIERAILHYRFGATRLGANRAVSTALRAWTALSRRLLPRRAWAYIVIQARRTTA